jgi:hypothetical protein
MRLKDCPRRWQRALVEDLIGGVLVGREGALGRWLDFGPDSLFTDDFPARLAGALFGDESLVYDCGRRLMTAGIPDARTALNGAPPGFEPPPGQTMAAFIAATGGRGVLVLDDLQAFDVYAIECLAAIADSGAACPEGSGSPTLSAKDVVILARARISVPSCGALARRARTEPPWPASPEWPRSFQEALRIVGEEVLPEHLRVWVVARFGNVQPDLAWDRYCELIGRGDSETAIFTAPSDPPQPLRPQGLPAIPRNVVTDFARLEDDLPDPGRFDVFVGYSWSRVSDNAAWLSERLRAKGYAVFLDKDELDLAAVPDAESKAFLIRKLRWAVRSSTARIIFAAMMRPYLPTPGFDRSDAVRRGLAIVAPNDILIEWNWQTLELRESRAHLVFERRVAYSVDHGPTAIEEVQYGEIHGREDLLEYALSYLKARGVLARGTARTSKP